MFGIRSCWNYVEPVIHAVYDEVQYLRDKIDISEALSVTDSSTAETLVNCEPLSDHLYDSARDELRSAIKDGDVFAINSIIDEGSKSTATPWCISALKTGAALMCTKEGVGAIRDATWNLLGCI